MKSVKAGNVQSINFLMLRLTWSHGRLPFDPSLVWVYEVFRCFHGPLWSHNRAWVHDTSGLFWSEFNGVQGIVPVVLLTSWKAWQAPPRDPQLFWIREFRVILRHCLNCPNKRGCRSLWIWRGMIAEWRMRSDYRWAQLGWDEWRSQLAILLI